MGVLERIKDIELEISRTQKNKATESHLGSLRAKLCQLRRQVLEEASGPGGGSNAGRGFEVGKYGDARIALVGFPSVGKSSLLQKLTGTTSEVASYEFTTLTCIPGIIHYNEAKIQLLDLPGIITGAASGQGRGRQVIATAKSADLIFIVLDATRDDTQKEKLERELDISGIRLNQRPPNASFTVKKTGGLKFNSTVPQPTVDEEVVKRVLHEYKLFNVELVLREAITVDQLLDIIEGNRKYVKCLYVYNKIDLLSIPELDEIARRPMSVPISAHSKLNFDGLMERAWQELALTRVYTKPKGEFPDFEGPVVLTPQRGTGETTVENAVLQIHRGLLQEMKSALVWGTSVKASPQICSLKHVLEDEDVIQVVKMTAAEMARARHGKKTGQCHAGTGIAMEKKGTTSKAEKIVGGKSSAHR